MLTLGPLVQQSPRVTLPQNLGCSIKLIQMYHRTIVSFFSVCELFVFVFPSGWVFSLLLFATLQWGIPTKRHEPSLRIEKKKINSFKKNWIRFLRTPRIYIFFTSASLRTNRDRWKKTNNKHKHLHFVSICVCFSFITQRAHARERQRRNAYTIFTCIINFQLTENHISLSLRSD